MNQGGDHNLQAGRDINVDKLIIQLSDVGSKPSKIARVISRLAKEIDEEIPEDYSSIIYYDIADKIDYNNVIRYKPIIDRYGFFGGIVEKICETLDIDKPNSKSHVFEYIKYLYTEQRSSLCGDCSQEKCLDLIRKNADNIIDQINIKLFDLISSSDDLKDVDIEDVKLSLTILIAVAFIDCKILEKPNKE
jgi:hypothetical protein